MKTRNLFLAATVILAIGASSAFAYGVKGSKHELIAGADANERAAANNELCVYCHTPHAANSEFKGAPIWNKPTPTNTSFQMYGTTLAGNTTESSVGDASKACLSCHDGVSGLNAVINGPGSGNYDPNGSYLGGTKRTMALVENLAIGMRNDLTNDHPIGIIYNPGDAGLKPIDTTLTNWGANKTIASLLRGPDKNRVECGSCHDPHNSDTGLFLRTNNAGSALCLGCHDK